MLAIPVRLPNSEGSEPEKLFICRYTPVEIRERQPSSEGKLPLSELD